MSIEINSLEQYEVIEGYKARFVHSETMTMVFWEVDPGAAIPMHSHPHEQLSQVTEGEFEMIMNGKTLILKPGSVLKIPSNMQHGGKALTACKITDIFNPVREDYKALSEES
ncbi:MAG: cupin domain-containing protein [Bacteroidota bacterium]